MPMAKKDVDAYFKQICNDYKDMIDALHDMEEEAAKNLISPDRLEAMKSQVDVVKNNYMRISYIMYLLNRPNRKSKTAKYDKQKVFDKKATLDGVHEENILELNKISKTTQN